MITPICKFHDSFFFCFCRKSFFVAFVRDDPNYIRSTVGPDWGEANKGDQPMAISEYRGLDFSTCRVGLCPPVRRRLGGLEGGGGGWMRSSNSLICGALCEREVNHREGSFVAVTMLLLRSTINVVVETTVFISWYLSWRLNKRV